MYFINKITSHSTVDFAAEELKKYLRMMMPEGGDVRISYAPDANDGFRLGLMSDFGLDTSDVKDPAVNDIIYIDTDERGGIIAGANYASVLLSVYEYFRQMGCRWLFPGIDGEYIPIKDITPVKHRFVPSCQCRAFCWESGVSHGCTLDMIDFVPKVGMSSFMLEHNDEPWYHEHYYHHVMNEENRAPEKITKAQVTQWKRAAETEIAKRSLQFHNIGHGFTIAPFMENTPENKKFYAEIDGARELYGGTPVYTNICMSNPEARRRAVEYIVEFTSRHSNTDYMHVWLADSSNNHCECEGCRRMRPSDFYMILMNELDDALTAAGIDKKVVVAVYSDTLWAPTEIKLNHPDRFLLMFAPIARSYTQSIGAPDPTVQTAPYMRNKLEQPRNFEDNFAYLNEWKAFIGSEVVVFEYHFWRHMALDPSGIFLAKRINEDVRVYKDRGLNGIIEDGSMRCFFPTGFAFYTYARTLYDTSLTIEELAEEYFECAFGEEWKSFYSYLERVGECFDFAYLEGERSKNSEFSAYYNPQRVPELKKIAGLADEGMELIKKYYNSDARVKTVSVRLLEHHVDYIKMLSEALCKKANGEEDEAAALYQKLRVEFGKHELAIERYYDHIGIMFGLSGVFKKGNTNKKPIMDFERNADAADSTDVYSVIHSIIELMKKSYGDTELRAGDLLRQSGFSDDYIRGRFIEVTGMTPVKYLNHIRLKNAKEMLTATTLTVNEVAFKCGFSDMSYFSRMFKSEYGMTPTKLKKNDKCYSLNVD